MAEGAVCRFMAWAMLGVFAAFSPAGAQTKLHFEGTFENADIDDGRWYLKQIRDPVVQQDIVRSGRYSLRLHGDFRFACTSSGEARNCIRNQIRIHRAYQLPIGTAAWYGISLRVEGEVARRGSIRTIVAEWKEHGGASPFAALRYDNGILHLTVQDNRCRRMVTADADKAEIVFPKAGRLVHGGTTVIRPNPNARYDPGPLDCDSTLSIEDIRPLPDPYGKWVDLAIFVKRHRAHGLVEIWADGALAGRARGPIGNDARTRCGANRRCRERSDATQYFKAGIYGDRCSLRHKELVDNAIAVCRRGEMSLYIDNIRRGATRADVDPSLLDPR
jgi:hypothetical protein